MAKTVSATTVQAPGNLEEALKKFQAALCDVCFSTAGLAIGTGSKKKVKIVTACKTLINGAIKSVAATTECTLAGTVANAKFNVFVIVSSDTDTVAAYMGTAAATLAAVVLPTLPVNVAVLGLLIVNPTGTGDFVGATTDLDDATVVPNAVYINTPYPFNPNLISL